MVFSATFNNISVYSNDIIWTFARPYFSGLDVPVKLYPCWRNWIVCDNIKNDKHSFKNKDEIFQDKPGTFSFFICGKLNSNCFVS